MKLRVHLLWPIASWIDRRPDWCWGELAMWAMGYSPLLDIFDKKKFRQKNEIGWCGKCVKTGRLKY